MALVDIKIVRIEGSFAPDQKEITIEWRVFSDSMLDFAANIADQGTTWDNMVDADGNATGWLPFGSQYHLGNDLNRYIFGGRVEISDPKIIGGDGDFTINVRDMTITPKHNDNPLKMWSARQTYSSDNPEEPEEEEEPEVLDEDNPYSHKVTVDVSYEWEDVPFTRDVETLVRVVNSIGQPFNPPAIRRQKIAVVQITRREYGNPIPKAVALTNTLAGSYFSPWLYDSVLPRFDNETGWTVTYNLKYNPQGWFTYILNTGYHYRDPMTGAILPILGDDGLPVSEPVRLTQDGLPIPHHSSARYDVGPFNKYRVGPSLAEMALSPLADAVINP
jgi:hypothetical protein